MRHDALYWTLYTDFPGGSTDAIARHATCSPPSKQQAYTAFIAACVFLTFLAIMYLFFRMQNRQLIDDENATSCIVIISRQSRKCAKLSLV